VDPIDGTRSFSSAVPLYAVLIALEEEGKPTLGCCHFPVLGETLVAARGAGAWLNGRAARVSACDDLAAARLVTSGFEYWRDRSTDAHRAGFDRLVRATRFARTWGDGYGYFLVATGRVDLLCDPSPGSYWDYAPMDVIVQRGRRALHPVRRAPRGRLDPGAGQQRAICTKGGEDHAGVVTVAGAGGLHEAHLLHILQHLRRRLASAAPHRPPPQQGLPPCTV
jgi:fructose-1,6-bisphosphatase/inositol monophosphatase family enzyme